MAKLGKIDGLPAMQVTEGRYLLEEDDLLLYALLQDPIYAAELLWRDPTNSEYAECYRVRDYQFPLWRPSEFGTTSRNYAGYACGRSTGKTESIKGKAFAHVFKRHGENMLISAPELIHLLPLTDAVEERIRDTRLTREFLDTRAGKTGFTHRPFGVDYVDGTKIVGRIPRLTGVGVKGQHQPDLLIDEAQDYPKAGWTEVHEPLALDEPVLTPSGPVPMGELEVGSEVFARDGSVAEVVGLSGVETRETFRVRFDDGSSVVTDANHRWRVTCRRYLREKWLTRTTWEMAQDLEKPGVAFGSLGQPWLLPDIGPLEYPPLAPPVDPYTLGVLLGDGTLGRTTPVLSVPPEKEAVRRDCKLPGGDTFSKVATPDRCPAYGIVGGATLQALEGMGLRCTSHEKFIPEVYLRATVDDRLALLQGLVDTDGNVHRTGAIRFTTSSDGLADGVVALVRSLGGRMSRGVVRNSDYGDYRDGWCIYFRLPTLVPTRHREGYRPSSSSDKMRRRVVAVEPTGEKAEVRCLMVDNPEHLFVLGNYVPTCNTVTKDHVDNEGNPDFTYEFYGVHSGARDSGFYSRINEGGFRVVNVTAIQRPGWSAEEKTAAKAAYGGTSSSDYRRNILGEPGSPASAFFVTARLMACVDQDRESHYNLHEYVAQTLRAEEVDELGMPIGEVLDLPGAYGKVYAGMDLGLTDSPTVISIFSHEKVKKAARLKLLRRIHLERFRTRQIREALTAITLHFGGALQSFGMDITGLGFPIFQEMEDDEGTPQRLLDVSRGYFFNAKVPVGVIREHIVEDQKGQRRDQFGSLVKEEVDPLTGQTRQVVEMRMIEASTRYLREFVDSGFLLLPFDTDITRDMQGETHQRVKLMGARKKKPNAFHILDSFRAMAMGFKAGEVEEAVALESQPEVLDVAMDLDPLGML